MLSSPLPSPPNRAHELGNVLQQLEVVSFRVFRVSFGVEFRVSVSGPALGQFRIRTSQHPPPPPGTLKLTSARSETDYPKLSPETHPP